MSHSVGHGYNGYSYNEFTFITNKIQRPPSGSKKVAVVDRWSLFRGFKNGKCDLVIVVIEDRWSLAQV